jgi:hypothetical protein
VPVISLWAPYQAMRDLAKASRSPRKWELEDTPPVIIIWWVLWLIVEFMNKGTFRAEVRALTLERAESPEQCALREVKEELDLDGTAATLIGAYPFEQMNQVIIAYHVPAKGTITLNEELDDFRHVPLHECKVWPAGTGFALRDWLRSKGIDPPVLEILERGRKPL